MNRTHMHDRNINLKIAKPKNKGYKKKKQTQKTMGYKKKEKKKKR